MSAGLALAALLATTAPALASAAPAVAPSGPIGPIGVNLVENWRGYAGAFHKTHDANRIIAVVAPGAEDGRALQLQLDARPAPGPANGVEIASNYPAFQYGTFGTRMKTANCAGQDRPGVVTGFLTLSPDTADANGNGLDDNHEIDVEVLCAQPEVIWMSLYTDYDERTDSPRKISRAVNLRTGQVLHNCYRTSWEGACEPLLPGENSPVAVTPVPDFNSAERFSSYSFNWQPNRVRFYGSNAKGGPVLLWDYQGPASRIPQKPAEFLQNVWHTKNWDPLNGPAHDQPLVKTSAFLDSTTVPFWLPSLPNWASSTTNSRDHAILRTRRPTNLGPGHR